MAGPTPITPTTPRVQDFTSTPSPRTAPPPTRVNVDNALFTGTRTPGTNGSGDFAFQGGAGKWAKFNVGADGTVSNVSSNMSLREQGTLFSSAGGRRLGAAPLTPLEKLGKQVTELEQRVSNLMSGKALSPSAPSRSDQIAALTEKVKALELDVKNRTAMLPSSNSPTATALNALTQRLQALLQELAQLTETDGTSLASGNSSVTPTAAQGVESVQETNKPKNSIVSTVSGVANVVREFPGPIGDIAKGVGAVLEIFS